MRSEIIGTKNLGIDFDDINKEKEKKVAADMPVRDTVTAIAVDSKSRESFYLKKITEEEKEMTEDVEDDFSQVMKKGMKNLEEVFLERKFDSVNGYTIPKKPKYAFFFRENVVFPSVPLELKKGHFELSNEELLMIIKYMELLNQTSLF